MLIKGEKGEAIILKQENGLIGPRGLPGMPGTKGEKGKSGFLSLKMVIRKNSLRKIIFFL